MMLRNAWGANQLRRIIAHELGHFFGLSNQGGTCISNSDDAVMTSPYACKDGSTTILARIIREGADFGHGAWSW